MRERGGTHFEERRERELKSHASQESLSLRRRVCCSGSLHASLGEGLACTPRRYYNYGIGCEKSNQSMKHKYLLSTTISQWSKDSKETKGIKKYMVCCPCLPSLL
jgi:hypothetical protein